MSEWDETGDAYALSFAMLTAGAAGATLDAVAARMPSGRLLDVGAGSGVLVGEALTRGYTVSASEPEASLRAVLARTFPEVTVDASGLPDLDVDDGSFDIVTAGFVLNHVRQPRAAAREMLRVTRSGGVVAATIWPAGASPLRPLWHAMATAVEEPLAVALSPTDDFPRTPDGVASLLADAGAREVAATMSAWTWTVTPERLWVAVEGGIASIGNLYRRVGPSARARMRQSFDETAASMVSASAELVLPHTAIVAVGRR